MPAICIVLAPENSNNINNYLVRLLKSFRRQRCLAEVARTSNVSGTFDSNSNTSVSHLSLQQQNILRRKTHSHSRLNKCRVAHWPPHCSRFLQRYPSVKRHLTSGGTIILINVCVRKPWYMVQHDFDTVRCKPWYMLELDFKTACCGMVHLQTIVNVLHAVEQRNGMSNTSCYYFLDPEREIDEDWWFSLARINKQRTCLGRAFSFCHAPFLDFLVLFAFNLPHALTSGSMSFIVFSFC